MRIKSLEIQGFKSFKDRVVLDLSAAGVTAAGDMGAAAGVTGVVGPNGCGKSNIVDALLWVMGEMSPKSLRGSNMDELIFSGAGAYAPAGVAEVTLVLERSAAPFVPESAAPESALREVSVTRRLYRSGESVYLMNRRECRLRDVQEFFLDLGAGHRGFAVVAQEAVSRLVTARPHERIHFIEEAAGVSKFKLREKETRRKLDLVEQNLVRLEDILREKKRSLGSLKSQAKKAQTWRKWRAECEDKELWLVSRDYLDQETNLAEAKKGLSKSAVELEGAQVQLAQREAASEGAKLELVECERALSLALGEGEAARERVRECELALRKLDLELQHEARNYESAVKALDVCEKEKAKALAEQGDLKALHDQETLQLERLQNLHKEGEERLASSKSAVKESKGLLEECVQNVQEQVDKEQNGREELVRLTEQEKALAARRELAKERVKACEQKRQELGARAKELSNKCDMLDTQKATIEGSLEKLEHEAKQLQETRQRVLQKLGDAKERVDKAVYELGALETLQDHFEGLEEGVKLLLKQTEPGTKASQLSLAADFVKSVHPGYELAVELCLGAFAESVVVKGADMSKPLALLRQKCCGARFVVEEWGDLGALRAEDQAALHERGLRPLLDVVALKEAEGANGLKGVLARSFLVDSVEQAMELGPLWPRCNFVTLAAEGFVAGSLVVGGAGGAGARRGKDAGYLARALRVADLRKELVVLQERSESFKQELGAVEHKCSVAAQSVECERGRRDELVQECAAAQKESAWWQEQLSAVLQERDSANKELSGVGDLFKNLEEKLSKAEQVLGGSKKHRERLEVERQARDAALARVRCQQEECEKALQKVHGNLVECRVGVEARAERLGAVAKSLEALGERVGHWGAARAKSDGLQQQLERERVDFNKKLKHLVERAGAAMALVAKEQDGLNVAKNKASDSDQAVREALQRVSAQKTRMAEHAATVGAGEIKQQHLCDVVRDKYQKDLPVVSLHYAQVPGDREKVQEECEGLRKKLDKLGGVNVGAVEELEELEKSYNFLLGQREDLLFARKQLVELMERIVQVYNKRFKETFGRVAERFGHVFRLLFGGGRASLSMIECGAEANPADGVKAETGAEAGEAMQRVAGVQILAQPPSKKLQNMSLLSGGEKALTALSLIFAIFLVRPAPFCLLDEVDAPLDDANVDRFNDLVGEMSKVSQVIVVTHNKRTMQACGSLFGVTMQERGVSKLVSVNLDHAARELKGLSRVASALGGL